MSPQKHVWKACEGTCVCLDYIGAQFKVTVHLKEINIQSLSAPMQM